MTRQERKWCWIYAALLAIVTTIPYLVGFAVEGEDWQFTGFVFGVEDGNSYIAKMLAGGQGAWLFRTPYTSQSQQGVIAFLPYLLLGKLASNPAMHEQLVAIYHLFRIITIPVLVLAIYRFIGLFVSEVFWRRWGTIMATAGGGLGWLLLIVGQSDFLGSLPLDFFSPESFGFLSIFGLPHLVLARALMFFGLCFYLTSMEQPRRGWYAGVMFLVLSLVQPLSVLTAYAVIAVHLAILLGGSLIRKQWQQWIGWMSAAARSSVIALPVVAYLTFSFTRDPFLRAWTAQNRILSPDPLHYLLAYGILLIPAFWGAQDFIQRRARKAELLIGWVLALPVLAYAPHNLQRRLPEGIWVAICALAGVGLGTWRRDRGEMRRMLALVILGASLLSSTVLLLGGIGTAGRPSKPAFRPAAEIRAFTRLNEAVDPWSVILTSYSTGNVLPAWAPVNVVVGHGPESADLELLLPQVEAFLDGELGLRTSISFLQQQNVDFILLGPAERDARDLVLEQLEDYMVVFDDGEYALYVVSDVE